MSLRAKLVLAQAPLAAALLAVGLAGAFLLAELGRTSETILADNFRSVRAAQRMLEISEQLDRAALLAVAGEDVRAAELAELQPSDFARELEIQVGNVTEPGEDVATQRLGARWSEQLAAYRALAALPLGERKAKYFERAQPAFGAVASEAKAILALNQDAMARASARASRTGERARLALWVLALLGLGLAYYASAALTSRLLRPVSVVAQAARRIAAGDLAARARIGGGDEIAALAGEFNAMAEQLERYRASSLGELLRAQRAAQATLDSLPDPVLVLGVAGGVLHVNRAAESSLGVDPDAQLSALPPPLRDAIAPALAHVASGKGSYSPRALDAAVSLATRDGERRYLPRAAPLSGDDGSLIGTTVVLEDVTRLERVEALRNDLVATVAHELRTPLTSLRMAVHLLAEERLGALSVKQADLVFAAREDAERLEKTVEELLDFSRLRAGRLELDREPLELERLVRDAVAAAATQATQAGVTLRNELLPGIAPLIGDRERLAIVLANLLQNAIRHSPHGETVRVRASAADGGVRLEVVDAGPGVPEAERSEVFERFYQGRGAGGGGAGLGLSISKEIVEAHGGEIGVESAGASGSVFWFRLPLG